MSNESDARKQSARDEADEHALGPLPDGGLKHSMPEWLRRRPVWELDETAEPTSRPDAAARAPTPSQVEPVELAPIPATATRSKQAAAEPEAITAEITPELPSPPAIEPDTTPIDPAHLVEIGDLPIWLQRIAERSAALRAAQAEETLDRAKVSSLAPESAYPPEGNANTLSSVRDNSDDSAFATRAPKVWVSLLILMIVIVVALWIVYYLNVF